MCHPHLIRTHRSLADVRCGGRSALFSAVCRIAAVLAGACPRRCSTVCLVGAALASVFIVRGARNIEWSGAHAMGAAPARQGRNRRSRRASAICVGARLTGIVCLSTRLTTLGSSILKSLVELPTPLACGHPTSARRPDEVTIACTPFVGWGGSPKQGPEATRRNQSLLGSTPTHAQPTLHRTSATTAAAAIVAAAAVTPAFSALEHCSRSIHALFIGTTAHGEPRPAPQCRCQRVTSGYVGRRWQRP